jgi:DNA-binding NarL/FixJ family response regulator
MTEHESGNNAPLKILIAEDHELARSGLSYSLEKKGNFDVVAEAVNGEQAVTMATSDHPDIILMDIGMPIMDGITATQHIKEKHPDIKIVMLTSHQDQEEVYAALSAGADAYCMKDIKIERLVQVLEMVMEGAIWLDPAIARVVMNSLPGKGGDKAAAPTSSRQGYNTELTDRELEVLEWIVKGKSNKEIADALSISMFTVKAHVGNIIQKLAVDDRTQAAVKALQDGLIASKKAENLS